MSVDLVSDVLGPSVAMAVIGRAIDASAVVHPARYALRSGKKGGVPGKKRAKDTHGQLFSEVQDQQESSLVKEPSSSFTRMVRFWLSAWQPNVNISFLLLYQQKK